MHMTHTGSDEACIEREPKYRSSKSAAECVCALEYFKPRPGEERSKRNVVEQFLGGAVRNFGCERSSDPDDDR